MTADIVVSLGCKAAVTIEARSERHTQIAPGRRRRLGEGVALPMQHKAQIGTEISQNTFIVMARAGVELHTNDSRIHRCVRSQSNRDRRSACNGLGEEMAQPMRHRDQIEAGILGNTFIVTARLGIELYVSECEMHRIIRV